MKVLCIGDPHIKVDNLSETDLMIAEIERVCIETKPDIIVCMGDILDRHSTIHVQCLIMAEKLVAKLSVYAPFYLIIGNHDRPNNSNFLTEEHAFNSMKKWPNVVVVDTVKTLKINFANFVFVPYVPNNRFAEALQKIDFNHISNTEDNTQPNIQDNTQSNIQDNTQCDNTQSNTQSNIQSNIQDNTQDNTQCEKYTAIFCHQEFKGAQMGKIISESGDVWDKESTLIISGHIHEYGNPQKNIYYVGAPRQQNFGESPDKMLSLFTFHNTKNTENKENTENTENKSYNHERINLNLPSKITIHLKTTEINDYIPDFKNKIKLVISGTESEIKVISKNKKLQELKKQGIKIAFHTVSDIHVKSEVYNVKKPYLERLLSDISDNPNLLKIWQTIF